MAVNTFTFGGVTSSTYGIYVSGEALFNAPKRDAEVIQIPGRDGDYVLDNGSFQNIEVTYRVFNQEKDLTDFRTKLANLRSALCSQTGYQRLTDTFHPDEYRMAAFIDGIEVNPVKYNTASEFEIKFNCKPQRFLTSGETKTSVANNGTINNPTLFESRPTLEFQGYGDITLGGQTVSVANVPIGDVLLANSENSYIDYPYVSGGGTGSVVTVITQTMDTSQLNTGDTISLDTSTYAYTWTMKYGYSLDAATISNQTGTGVSTSAVILNGITAVLTTTFDAMALTKGTSLTKTHTYTVQITWDTYSYSTASLSISIAYDGANTITLSAMELFPSGVEGISGAGYLNSAIGYSTKSASGTKTIDLDIGEAYWNNSGTITSLNFAVTLPPKLPTLASGSNTITYPNTITNFKITPHWWKV